LFGVAVVIAHAHFAEIAGATAIGTLETWIADTSVGLCTPTVARTVFSDHCVTSGRHAIRCSKSTIASASIGTSASATSIRSITIVFGITEKFFAEFALETSIAFTNTSHANTSLDNSSWTATTIDFIFAIGHWRWCHRLICL